VEKRNTLRTNGGGLRKYLRRKTSLFLWRSSQKNAYFAPQVFK
jgi:hypothetical protein